MKSRCLKRWNPQPCQSSGQYHSLMLRAKYLTLRWMTKFALDNGYINGSVHKADIPGFLGCLEHATVIWSAIQEARKEKHLHVVWLDLAKAYGSVSHKLIQKTMDFFHIPEEVQDIILRYNDQFHMRFSTKDYGISWQPLELGMPMGCTISPLPFVIAMEKVWKGVEKMADRTEASDGSILPPIKVFNDDITILMLSSTSTISLLPRLMKLIKWARMKFQAAKSRSTSHTKGRGSSQSFTSDDEHIPTL